MRQIQLTQGKVALVDDADYDWLKQWEWSALRNRSGHFYTARNSQMKNKKQYLIFMHREILGLGYGDKREADHQNHNQLDNRQDNLRICTHQQNNMNRKSNQNATSGYKGVSWHRKNKKWRADIETNKKKKYLGSFISEKEAALAYNEAAMNLFGEFAFLNLI